MIKVFNDTYKRFLCTVSTSFDDVPELAAELDIVQRVLAACPDVPVFHQAWERQVTQEVFDQINISDPRCIDNEVIGFLERSRMKMIFHNRMREQERPVLWKVLQELGRLSMIIRCCGTKLDEVQGITKGLIATHKAKNPGKKLNPADLQSTVMEQMMSGGEHAQQMLNVLDEKTIGSILKNIGNIMSIPGAPDINKLLKEPLEKMNLKELTSEVRDQLQETIDNQGEGQEELHDLVSQMQGHMASSQSLEPENCLPEAPPVLKRQDAVNEKPKLPALPDDGAEEEL